MKISNLSLRAADLRLVSSCLALLLVAACSSSAPTSPSGEGSGVAATTGGAGAIIEGTVTAASGAGLSSFRPSQAVVASPSAAPSMVGMRVRVVGTDLAATVGESGTFRLADVPGGTVRLQFQSDTVNATTEIVNVSGDQVIQVQVQVGTTSAVIVNDVREGKARLCHAEGNGSYHFIEISESSEGAHRAHGDGKVGDAVPGRTGMTFDETCRPVGPAVEIRKFTNGEDANNAPGPDVKVGDPVLWDYRVSNTGTLNLTNVVVTDDRGVTVDCKGQTTLAPAASMTCTGSGVATLGQYRNVGTVTANWVSASASGSVTDSDVSHYLGVVPVDEEDGAKVTLCHKTGAGFYVKSEVSASAESAHRAHGDAKPGEPVPGLAGKVFSASCVPQ
jgi:hypothetical protein